MFGAREPAGLVAQMDDEQKVAGPHPCSHREGVCNYGGPGQPHPEVTCQYCNYTCDFVPPSNTCPNCLKVFRGPYSRAVEVLLEKEAKTVGPIPPMQGKVQIVHCERCGAVTHSTDGLCSQCAEYLEQEGKTWTPQPVCGATMAYDWQAATPPPSVQEKVRKPRWSLLPWFSLGVCVGVMEFGAVKHSTDGWKQVPDAYNVYKDAAARHLAAIMQGEHTDPETGYWHAAHLACCALIMVWHAAQKNDAKPV